jgi:DNA-binding beta-propeller fold protein YncE
MALVLAADPEAGHLYAALPLEQRIGVFDAQSLERVSEISTAGRVRDMEFDRDTGWLFTGSYFNGVVEQFDTRTGERLGSWRVGSLLRGVAWDAANRQLYTASAAGVHRIEVESLE